MKLIDLRTNCCDGPCTDMSLAGANERDQGLQSQCCGLRKLRKSDMSIPRLAKDMRLCGLQYTAVRTHRSCSTTGIQRPQR